MHISTSLCFVMASLAMAVAYNKLEWTDCGPADRAVKINNLEASPMPVQIPGTITPKIDAELLRPVGGNIAFKVQVWRWVLWGWVKIPCIKDFGSCTYEDGCSRIASGADDLIKILSKGCDTTQQINGCPACITQQLNLPCVKQCPLPVTRARISTVQIDLPKLPSWIPVSADYKAKAQAFDRANGDKELGCVEVKFTID